MERLVRLFFAYLRFSDAVVVIDLDKGSVDDTGRNLIREKMQGEGLEI